MSNSHKDTLVVHTLKSEDEEDIVLMGAHNKPLSTSERSRQPALGGKKRPNFNNMISADSQRFPDGGMFGTAEKQNAKATYWQSFDVVRDQEGQNIFFVKCNLCHKVMKRAENAKNNQFDTLIKNCLKAAGESKQAKLEDFTAPKVSHW